VCEESEGSMLLLNITQPPPRAYTKQLLVTRPINLCNVITLATLTRFTHSLSAAAADMQGPIMQ
jgi:hypothetical protein